jgi:hypothetical protein
MLEDLYHFLNQNCHAAYHCLNDLLQPPAPCDGRFDLSITLKFTIMKTMSNRLCSALFVLLFSTVAVAQKAGTAPASPVMQTFLIERELPGAGGLTPVQLKGVAQKSCTVLKDMGPGIEWVQSYVTGNKVYCIYKAESEAKLREHGDKGGFPVTAIIPIASQISPATAKE